MRSTGMRAMTAGFLGMAAIMLAAPAASAAPTNPGEPGSTPTATATATATPATGIAPAPTPTSTPGADATTTASPDASATPLGAGLLPGATATASASAEATPSGLPVPSVSPGIEVSATGKPSTGNEGLDRFLDLLPFRVPFDKEINGVEDIDINPLVLTFTCTGAEPSWQLRNTSDKSFGFGWFDTSLGGGILDIGPQQTVPLPSKAIAVIGSPWDAETKELLVAIPTIGVSNCAGVTPTTIPAIAAPVALPAAAPAAAVAVQAEPYYTG
ncbi:hypothetical protein MXD61_07065 [Frankia sp. AgPm24]|uniref:hypothetical protein n=1 Tax=Frankia sp. AgPm24 TaxID=631128 RepID=UPI00200EF2FD|nr:hypothetical protein [Frankia sp. AgPm24]MCK9921652.1 hypothetical protein [Frankia sp. AgPm24]